MQLRNSPELSNLLDSAGTGILDLEQQQKDQTILIEREHAIREAAAQMKQTAQVLRAATDTPIDPEQVEIASDDGIAESSSELIEAYDDVNLDEERARVANRTKTTNAVMEVLKATGQIMGGTGMLAGRGVYAVTSGLVKGITNSLTNTAEPDSDDNTEYTGATGSAGPSNDDLNLMRAEELRRELRRLNNATGQTIAGRAISNMRRDEAWAAIVRLRG